MLRIDVPGRESLALEHVVLDLNGTLALDGVFVEGVLTRLERLQRQLAVWVVTADTRGEAQALVQDLEVNLHKVDRGDEAAQKRAGGAAWPGPNGGHRKRG
jgi:soluble P-type ATPase